MNSKSGLITIALFVGIAVAGAGLSILTHRHNAIVVRNQEIGVDMTKLTGKRAAVQDNPKTTAAIIAAAIAAGLAADQIHIGDNNYYGEDPQ